MPEPIKVTLKRRTTGKFGTFGELFVTDRDRLCHTLELPWDANKTNVSCIPKGTYTVRKHFSAKFGNVFKVHDVEGRTDILIHVGNWLHDTLGCILVGMKKNSKSVLRSRRALKKLKGLFGNNEIELTITEDY